MQLDVDANIWLFKVPGSESRSKAVMERTLTDAIIPAAKKLLDNFIKQRISDYKQFEGMSEEAARGLAMQELPRVILTNDGELTFLEATKDIFIAEPSEAVLAAGFENVKSAASASKTQQANDVAPCYKDVRRWNNHRDPKWQDAPYTPYLERILAEVDGPSRKSFISFLRILPSILAKAFTKPAIQLGWSISGLWPYSEKTILQRCTSWNLMTAEQSTAIFAAMPKLVEVAYAKGEVTDDDMQAAVGAAIDLEAFVEQKSGRRRSRGMKLEDMVLSRRRAVWYNHNSVVEREKAKKAAKEAAQAATAARAASRAAKPTPPPAVTATQDPVAVPKPAKVQRTMKEADTTAAAQAPAAEEGPAHRRSKREVRPPRRPGSSD